MHSLHFPFQRAGTESGLPGLWLSALSWGPRPWWALLMDSKWPRWPARSCVLAHMVPPSWPVAPPGRSPRLRPPRWLAASGSPGHRVFSQPALLPSVALGARVLLPSQIPLLRLMEGEQAGGAFTSLQLFQPQSEKWWDMCPILPCWSSRSCEGSPDSHLCSRRHPINELKRLGPKR